MSEFEKKFWRMVISQLDLDELSEFEKEYKDNEDIAEHEQDMLDLIREFTNG